MGLCLKWGDGLVFEMPFEMLGSHSKRQGCDRNAGLTSETRGLCSKRRVRVRNNGLMFEPTGLCSKCQARFRTDGLVFKTTEWCSKFQVHVRNDRLASTGARDEVASWAASTFALAIVVDSGRMGGHWCLWKELAEGWMDLYVQVETRGVASKWDSVTSPCSG